MLAVLKWWQKSDVTPKKILVVQVNPAINNIDRIMSCQFSVMKSQNTSFLKYFHGCKNSLASFVWHRRWFSPGQVFIGVDFGTSGCRAVGGPTCWDEKRHPWKTCQWKLAILNRRYIFQMVVCLNGCAKKSRRIHVIVGVVFQLLHIFVVQAIADWRNPRFLEPSQPDAYLIYNLPN